MDNSHKPNLRAYVGGTGSGKGVSIRAYLSEAKPKRLLVWDPLAEYSAFATPTNDLAKVCAELQKKQFAVAYRPPPDVAKFPVRFDLFCRAAFAAGDLTLFVEELADVTRASYAPPPWRRLSKQGRHRGMTIIAATQRPADADKAFLSGCTYYRCFELRMPNDRKAMADVMQEPLEVINGLQTVEVGEKTHITYLEKDLRVKQRELKTIIVG
jgi:hypothetical protein